MSIPEIVQSTLGDEQVAATVPLGGEDALYVTPTRTLIYRGDGLLSDESVVEYSHDAERIEVSEGRRKATVALDYGIDGVEEFTVPAKRLHDALHPVLAGVLNGAGVTDANEQVIQTYQFSELTLVVTSARVVKHVGEAVWDEDFEQYHFEDVTRLDVEEGTVSSQIIIEADGRPQRVKTPSDRTREVRERVERALLSYHDADSYAEFERSAAPDDAGDEASDAGDADDAGDDDPFGGGVDPIQANPPELDDDGQVVETDSDAGADDGSADAVGDTANTDAGTATDAGDVSADVETGSGGSVVADDPVGDAASGGTESADAVSADDAVSEDEPAGTGGDGALATTGRESTAESREETADGESSGFAGSGFEPAEENMGDDVEERLAALTEAVERQNELLERQQRTIERLVDRLSRDQ
ncbi:DUF7115 domain-containing protein [Halomicrococcus sp. SG-WS-1]|uniref:DUF7115 domain-containing protein n=1 Tax=Halomicrococcus sp. SG-WS-1 TaxID=3439057 RepID=UPI003F798023